MYPVAVIADIRVSVHKHGYQCENRGMNKKSAMIALTEFVDHFHAERNHQGKGNVLLFPPEKVTHKPILHQFVLL